MHRPDFTEDMRALCKVFVNPVTSQHDCLALSEDKRCVGPHKSLDIIDLVMRGIKGDPKAAETICKSACWSDIVKVFTNLAGAVQAYDASNVSKTTPLALANMCEGSSNVQIQARVSESTDVQCAINVVKVEIDVTDFQVSGGGVQTSIPVGSSIIVSGLNARPLSDGDKLRVTRAVAYTTSAWQNYPGSTLPFKGGALSGNLKIEKGESDNDLKLSGVLNGLPAGVGGIYIHVGCDVNLANSVGDHYFDSKICDDPWDNVKYDSTNGIIDAMVPGVPWATTLGHVIVIHNSMGQRVAIARIVLMDASSELLGNGFTLHLPPHLALDSWASAICQEDYTPAKSCSMSSIPDSCSSSLAVTPSCRSESRQRWCDKPALLVLKVTRVIDTCPTMAFDMIMHNPPLRQLDARVIVSGHGPGITIDPVHSSVPSGKAGVLSSVMTPQFVDFSITELGCSIDNEKHPTATQLQMCLGPTLTKVTASPGTNLIFQGRCAGMENELLVSVTPNIDLDSGSTITISGLIRRDPVGRDAPKLRVDSSAGIHNHLGVVEWHEQTGTLVLVILESNCLQPAKMAAGVKSTFTLQILMPEIVGALLAISPSIRASLPPSSPAALASCTETAQMCSLPLRQAANPVLQTQESPASVVIRAISQQTCMPGACSSLTVAFSINKLLDHNSYFIVSGLTGMTRYVPLEFAPK